MQTKARNVTARPLLCFSVAFSSAALFVMLFFSVSVWLGAAVAAVAGLVLLAGMLAFPRFRLLVIPIGLIAGALWCAGFIWVKYLPAVRLDGLTEYISFTCDSYSTGYGDYGAVDGRITRVGGKPVSIRARLYLDDGSPGLEPGDSMELAASLGAVPREVVSWHITSGRYIWASQKGSVEITKSSSFSLRHWGARTARAIGDKLAQMLSGDEAGLIIALLTGDRSRYSRDFSAALMNSGTSHITAVSGMHITILVGIMTSLLGKKRGIYISLPAVLMFSAISGFVPSIMRAAIMCFITVLAFSLRRESDTLTSLFTALLLLVLVNPFSITAASLTLSFVSTLGIILFSPMLSRGMRKLLPRGNGRIRSALDTLCSTTAAAVAPMAATLPLCALYFPRVSLISALATQLVLPALTLTMAFGIVAALMSPIWMAGATFVARYILRWPLKLMLDAILWLGGKKWVASSGSVYFILAILTLLIVFIAVWAKKLRGTAAFFIACTAFCAFFSQTAFENGAYSDIAISGTNGSAIVLIRSGDRTAAVNMGGINRGRSAQFVDDTLAEWGFAYLDCVVLTSGGYRDTGGLEQALERVSAGQIYLPDGQIPRGANDKTEILWYDSRGALDFGGFTVELYASGDARFIPRVVCGDFSIVNTCGVLPIAALHALKHAPTTDILLVDKNYSNSTVSFEKLCAALGVRAVVLCEDDYSGTSALAQAFSGTVLHMSDLDDLRIKIPAN